MMICNYKQDSKGEKIGSVKIYVYDDDIPTRIVEETNVPNHQAYMSDPLTSVTKYEYDKLGNVIKQSMSSYPIVSSIYLRTNKVFSQKSGAY